MNPVKSLKDAVTIVGLVGALKAGLKGLIPRRKKKVAEEE